MFEIPLAERPSHVPEKLVRDFDIYSIKTTDDDLHLHIKELLQGPGVPDVFWTPRNGGHWVAARGKPAKEVLTKPEFFSSRRIVPIKAMNPDPPFAPLMIDPPDHKAYRSLIAPAFAPNAVQKLGDDARELAIELIEGFKGKGECEFVGDFATWLPIAIFMSMVDLPREDRPKLLKIADALVRGQSLDEHADATSKLHAYAQQKIDERRASPGDDLISHLTQQKVNGEPVDDFTLLGMVTLLLTAGLDTVANMMSFFAIFLANNPEHRRRLIEEPDTVKQAVEEMLRRFPIANVGREVVQDCTFEGADLHAGEMIVVPTMAYGLDDRVFDNPETVDFDRNSRIHQTFGDGAHRCMGSMLARIELRVFIEEWLKRIPDFCIKPGAHVHAVSASVAGVHSLPLVWEVS